MSAVDALLPVLVAELADEEARRLVEALARERRVCLVPLVDAPVDASLHVLEVSTPGHAEPLLVLAEPVGAPTEQGFPLRLHPYGDPPSQDDDDELPLVLRPRLASRKPPSTEPIPTVKATRPRPTTLTQRHTRDLLGEGAAEIDWDRDAKALVGRDIAAGKLVIEELVGVGGMGAVFRARHKQLGKEVAVKVLHSRFRDDLAFCARFHAEALAVSQLDHPNVVRILDYGQEPDGMLYIAMDYLSGLELEEVRRREGVLPFRRIVELAIQVSAALGHAHSRGIVHRDVKPSNIVLVRTDDDEGRAVEVAKVCDFGIAAHAGARDLVGTPAYMSPEQCEGGEVDGRSDVYSLGVILYELATGRLPFHDPDAGKLVRMHLEETPPRPSSVTPVDARLEELVLRCLQKSPEHRPQSMRELRAALREMLKPPSLDLHEVGAGRESRTATGNTPLRPPPPSVSRISAQVHAVDPAALAEQLAREPVSTLREALTTPERFAQEARSIAAAMRVLLEKRELAALAHVVAIFRKVASDPGADARGEICAKLVRTLQDPKRLVDVAERALVEQDDAAPALLAGLDLAGAHALYAARMRVHATPPVRGRFVAALRAIGLPAWPLVSAALQRNLPEAKSHDPRLAEDLLRAVPLVADEAMGGVVAKYLRWGEAPVRRAAIAPLAALWGDRSRALLLAVLSKDPDEGARVAATKGLRDLRAVDEHVVRKLDELLGDPGDGAVGLALKTAVAEALGEANPDARAAAAAALKQHLAPKGGVFGRRKAGPSAAPQVLLTMARAYSLVAKEEANKLIDELAKSVDDPLKTQLRGLIVR